MSECKHKEVGFKNYKEFAFNHTLVEDFMFNNLCAINKNGKVYYDDGVNIQTFANEEKALQYVLKTLDISKHYRFFDVFYEVQNSGNGKLKYKNYICIMTRKTNKTKNHIRAFLINPNSGIMNDGNLVDKEEFTKEDGITKNTPFNTVDKDLTHICGMELDPIVQCEITTDTKTLYDLRDNFIIDEILPNAKDDNKITCSTLYKHINTAYKLAVKYINSPDNARIYPDIALVDISGSYIKTTGIFDGEKPIVINDSLDIYREFIGGTTKSEEDFNIEDTDEDDETINNDDNYT